MITTATRCRQKGLSGRSVCAFVLLGHLYFWPAANANTALSESKLALFVQQTMAAGAIPGMALLMVKEGTVLTAKGYGVTAEGQRFTADTPVLIASLSKAMTAAVALMLVADGRIDLDAPVKRYLPEFRVDSPDGGAAITVRHLLNQTSGLSDSGFPAMRLAQPETLAGMVGSLQAAVPTDPPGTTFHYFNSNYALVARIVEVVSDTTFEAVLENRLFKPLGMAATKAVPTYAIAQLLLQPPATGHVVAYGHAWRSDEPGGFIGGHGGVISTANDMGRWLQWQMTGQPAILPAELLALMQTPPARSHYAMGWFQQQNNRQTTIWHDGVFATVYADIAILPDRQLGIVLLYGIGGALPAATTFPAMRAGALAIASGDVPEKAGVSLVTTGRLAGAATLLLGAAALADLAALRSRRRRARTAPLGQVVMGFVIRLIPMVLLLSLPWLLQLANGRAFSLEAIFFAMLDVTLGLAIVAAILAVSAVLRLIFAVQHFRRSALDTAGKPR